MTGGSSCVLPGGMPVVIVTILLLQSCMVCLIGVHDTTKRPLSPIVKANGPVHSKWLSNKSPVIVVGPSTRLRLRLLINDAIPHIDWNSGESGTTVAVIIVFPCTRLTLGAPTATVA